MQILTNYAKKLLITVDNWYNKYYQSIRMDIGLILVFSRFRDN